MARFTRTDISLHHILRGPMKSYDDFDLWFCKAAFCCETNPFKDGVLIVAPLHKQHDLPAGVTVDWVHLENKQSVNCSIVLQ